MVDAGCQCVFVVDSSGYLVMEQAGDRVKAVVEEVGGDAEVGFHGHQNLSFGVANSLLAVRNGATQIDGTLYGLGAGAGNAPLEVLATVFDRLDINIGDVDPAALQNAAEEVLRPMVDRLPMLDRGSIVQGQMGVYNSFLFHAERAETRYGVQAADILREVGRRGYVGGQEDMIIDVAVDLQKQKVGAGL